MLEKAYWMEIETVMSYVTNSTNPDGVRAMEIKQSLEADIAEELQVTRSSSRPENQGALWRGVPARSNLPRSRDFLQPPEEQTDIPHVIRGVIEAEAGAISFYNEIIEFAGDVDPVTEDMVITILRDEQGHMRTRSRGFSAKYEAEGKAYADGGRRQARRHPRLTAKWQHRLVFLDPAAPGLVRWVRGCLKASSLPLWTTDVPDLHEKFAKTG